MKELSKVPKSVFVEVQKKLLKIIKRIDDLEKRGLVTGGAISMTRRQSKKIKDQLKSYE